MRAYKTIPVLLLTPQSLRYFSSLQTVQKTATLGNGSRFTRLSSFYYRMKISSIDMEKLLSTIHHLKNLFNYYVVFSFGGLVYRFLRTPIEPGTKKIQFFPQTLPGFLNWEHGCCLFSRGNYFQYNDLIFSHSEAFTDINGSFLSDTRFVSGTCLLVGVPPIADDSCKK